jgi:hypothetical protein
MDQIGELGEDEFSGMHPDSLAKNLLGENRVKSSLPSHRELKKTVGNF